MSSLSSILTNISNSIPELTSKSATAIYKKLASALSIVVDSVIEELANTENIINSNISQNNYGKAGYYINAALYYEDGENMISDPITADRIYDPVDISKRTITQAAFDEGTLTLKVAYTDPSTGRIAKLPTAVLARFIDYFNSTSVSASLNGGFVIPGIPINILSDDPNVFNASSFTVTYYGSYSLTNVQSAVIAAMNAFRDSFLFNGIIFINDLTDYIKANVPGVRDVTVISPTIDSVAFSGSKALSAGYFDYDAGLSITYTAI